MTTSPQVDMGQLDVEQLEQAPTVLVGCGFLGSIWTDEFLKRMYAGSIYTPLLFIDSDSWEMRNLANQSIVSALDVAQDTSKAATLCRYATERLAAASAKSVRVTEANIRQVIPKARLIVDAVDNLETRQLLWMHGMWLDVPTLHLGISQQGTGVVQWSDRRFDNFHLAPAQTVGKTIVDPESGALPPCELARMRGVGLQTGFAGAVAAAIYFGFDPESYLGGEPTFGWLTSWATTHHSFHSLKEAWFLCSPD